MKRRTQNKRKYLKGAAESRQAGLNYSRCADWSRAQPPKTSRFCFFCLARFRVSGLSLGFRVERFRAWINAVAAFATSPPLGRRSVGALSRRLLKSGLAVMVQCRCMPS